MFFIFYFYFFSLFLYISSSLVLWSFYVFFIFHQVQWRQLKLQWPWRTWIYQYQDSEIIIKKKMAANTSNIVIMGNIRCYCITFIATWKQTKNHYSSLLTAHWKQTHAAVYLKLQTSVQLKFVPALTAVSSRPKYT